MARKRTNKNLVIVALIVMLLLLAVGYAAFSDTLTISGTANANGKFDIQFENAEIVSAVGVTMPDDQPATVAEGEGTVENVTSAEIVDSGNTLKVNVADLSYPGAGVEFSVDIVNKGTVSAKVNEITTEGIKGNDLIKVEGLDQITKEHPTLKPTEKCNIHFIVYWPEDSDVELKEDNSNISFSLGIEYTQSDENTIFTGKASHDWKTATGEIVKRDPTGYEAPTGLKAFTGETLAEVQLPEGYTWKDNTQSVGEAGTNKFTAIYTPENTEYFNTAEVEVEVEVREAVSLAQTITGADYGKEIDYSVTVNGETIDSWRIFSNDGETVKIISTDFVPQTAIPEAAKEAGLKLVSGSTYNVNSSTDRDTLVNALKTESYWTEYAAGAEEATAKGGPTNEEFVASWNANEETKERQLEAGKYYYGSTNGGALVDGTTKVDGKGLYVPYTSGHDGCYGYWLASPYAGNTTGVWYVYYNGAVSNDSYASAALGVRPVVSLPSSVVGDVSEMVTIK